MKKSDVTTKGPERSRKDLRVLQLVAMLHSGGPERWLTDLCPAGRKEGLLMDIAVVYQTDGLFARRARELGIAVYHCEGSGNPIRFIRNLRKLLREQGPYDAVHSHLHAYSAFVVLAAWLEGVPARVVHSHNVVKNSSRTWKRRLYIGAARVLIRIFGTAGMGPSSASTEDLFGPNWRHDPRWRVMPCGISLEPFRRPVPPAINRQAFGIPEGSLVLGSVGRLHPEKNSELLVEVLGEVLRLNSDSYLVMVGEGPLRERLERIADEGGYRGRLKLLGTRSDVADIIRGVFDVFVFPSPPPPRGNEALPIAVVEAQAAGVPTVISDGVTDEAIVVPQLVRQISADAGAATWAKTAVDQALVRDSFPVLQALETVESSHFNCNRNIEVLSKLYVGSR